LSDLTPHLIDNDKSMWSLIGGDFNASVQCDERMPSYAGDNSHKIFFDRLENFRLRDCVKKFRSETVQTLRHSRSDFPWQNDYLFAGKKLYEACNSCDVIDDPDIYEISDHNPIIGEFDL